MSDEIFRQAIHPARLGFDIDGVVADTMEAFIRLAREEYGIHTILPDHITEFEVEECLDINPCIITSIFDRLLQEPVAAGLQPMKNAVPVLREFAEHSPLTFITARPEREPVEEWLTEVLGADIFHSSKLIAMGDHDNKAQYILNAGLSHFIDDRAETCLQLKESGITPMVYEQPWNRGKHLFQTVSDWHDIRALCFNSG